METRVVPSRLLLRVPSADRNLVNVPPLQFPEEVQQVHGLVFASFWKRESLRTPSHAGSKRKVAAVVPFGFESESCSSGNAFSSSPSIAYPRAASYSELGSSHRLSRV